VGGTGAESAVTAETAVCAVVVAPGSGEAGSVAAGLGSTVGEGASVVSTRTAGRVSVSGGAVTAAVAQLAAPTPSTPRTPVVTQRRLLMVSPSNWCAHRTRSYSTAPR